LTKMQIDSSVAEADVGGIEEGQSVDFTVDAYPYRNFRGLVTQVRNSPTTVNNVVTYDCVISVKNPDYKLKPGMTANVSVIVAQRHNVLTIPNSALRFHPPEDFAAPNSPASNVVAGTNAIAAPGGTNRPARFSGRSGGGSFGGQGGFHRMGGAGSRQTARTVYILSGEAAHPTLKPAQIKIGISDGISTEVLEGLKEGDQVITAMISGESAAKASNPFGGGFPGRR
jgi:HlyD family secretion protein